MRKHSLGMKIVVWIAVLTLVITALAPLFYAFDFSGASADPTSEQLQSEGTTPHIPNAM
jgi:hypothetical protein